MTIRSLGETSPLRPSAEGGMRLGKARVPPTDVRAEWRNCRRFQPVREVCFIGGVLIKKRGLGGIVKVLGSLTPHLGPLRVEGRAGVRGG
jgi:hypothetical protein